MRARVANSLNYFSKMTIKKVDKPKIVLIPKSKKKCRDVKDDCLLHYYQIKFEFISLIVGGDLVANLLVIYRLNVAPFCSRAYNLL